MWAGTIMQASHMPLCQCAAFQNNSPRPRASPEPTPGSAGAPRSRSAHVALAAGPACAARAARAACAARTALLQRAVSPVGARAGGAGGARGPVWPLPEGEAWGCAPQHRDAPKLVRYVCPAQSRSAGSSSWDLEPWGWGCAAFHGGLESSCCPPGPQVVPRRGEEVSVPGEHAVSGRAGAAIAAGTGSGHRGRSGLARAQATEPLPHPGFLPAAFSALKAPSPREVSLAGAVCEGFGLPAMSLKRGRRCRARGSLGRWGAAWSVGERASAEPLRQLSPSSPSPPESPREESAP